MNFTVLRDKFQKALHTVGRAVNTRSPLPVLSNVLIKTEKGRIKVTASDLQINISSWIGAKVDEEGEITIPAKVLTEFVNQLTDEKLDASLEGSILKVKTDKAKASFSGIPATEFPQIDVYTDGVSVRIKSTYLIDAVSHIQFATAVDESRPILTGIYFRLENEELVLAGTDGYRMAEYRMKVDTDAKEIIQCVVPAKALTDIIKSFGAVSEEIEILINKERNVFIVKGEDLEAQLRMLDGEYPDYQAVIPAEFTGEIKVQKSELLSGIKLASIFTRESGNSVKIVANGDGVETKSQPTEAGSNVTKLNAEYEGDDIEITFNAKYLIDFLSNIEDSEITFKVSGPLKPGLFKIADKDNYFFLAMPMKANW